jgi:hypothetical protein
MKKSILILTVLLSCGLAATAQVPNPYTYNDVPDIASEVPLGLPAHNEDRQPDLQKPRPQVSFCAYRIGNHGTPAKVFYNAASKRQFSVSSGINPATGEMQVIKTLSIPDSLAIYRIDDATRTITKLPGEGMQALNNMDVKTKSEQMTEEEMAYNSDRWCYMKTIVTTETFEGPYGSQTDEHYRTSYIDPETGITLCEDADGIVTFTRNIHLGVPYPEVFELPEGYRFVVQDLSSGLDAYKKFEEQMKDRYQKLLDRGVGETRVK